MAVTVRRVRPEDAEALFSVRLRALATDPDAFLTMHDAEAARGLDVWIDRAARGSVGVSTATFLGWGEAAAVGLVVMVPGPMETTAELVGMWVAPEARRTGLGRSLVEAGLAWAAESGFEDVVLCVASDNVAAAAFYGALGFEFTGVERNLLGPDGMVVKNMRLGLTR